MSARRMRRAFAASGIAALAACGVVRPATGPGAVTPDANPPAVQREMRGLWIATVRNIDWPSRTGLTAAQQQAELIDLLDRARDAGLNAIFFQVRPNADALYRSSLEPWGMMFSGTQADPGWDPLEFAVREAHARGLQLHAWFNPYRAGNVADSLQFAANHVSRTNPEIVRRYGGGQWMDPGEPETLERTMRVVLDVVRRYDVDGVHTDDYFYPYPIQDSAGRTVPFPDSASYARYGNGLARDDWRRANVDRFVERFAREVHAIKPTVQVGISPFGIWRPGYPAQITGLDAYAALYADARKWIQEGWLDYLAPQLYWASAPPQQSFPVLLDWWIAQNPRGRHLWPGLAVYRENTTERNPFPPGEIVSQIRQTRARSGSTGHLLYNTTWTLKRNGDGMAPTLAREVYQAPTIPPASPWLDRTPGAPGAPTLVPAASALRIAGNGEAARWWVVQVLTDGGWTTRVQPAGDVTVSLGSARRVLVFGVDAAGVAGAVTEWRR